MAVLQAEYAKAHDCETASPSLRKQEGCDAPKPQHERWVFDGLSFDRCPHYYLKRAHVWLQEAFEIYRWKQSGFLPQPGSWLDQPNLFVEVIEYIEYLIGVKQKSEQQAITNRAASKR